MKNSYVITSLSISGPSPETVFINCSSLQNSYFFKTLGSKVKSVNISNLSIIGNQQTTSSAFISIRFSDSVTMAHLSLMNTGDRVSEFITISIALDSKSF
jgi:hypothetical protein